MNEASSVVPIVIVDDVHEDLVLVERIFRQCKILNPIKLLKTGEECIAYFEAQKNSSESNGASCLLLLDLLMPTGGLDVLRRLRDQNLGDGSILVMLSGITDISAINEGYQLGARTFLVKPVTAEDLIALVGSLQEHFRIEDRQEGHLLHWAVRSSSSAQSRFRSRGVSRTASVCA